MCDTISSAVRRTGGRTGGDGEVLQRSAPSLYQGSAGGVAASPIAAAGRLAPIPGACPTSPRPIRAAIPPTLRLVGAVPPRAAAPARPMAAAELHRIGAANRTGGGRPQRTRRGRPVGSRCRCVEALTQDILERIRFDSGGWLQRLLGKGRRRARGRPRVTDDPPRRGARSGRANPAAASRPWAGCMLRLMPAPRQLGSTARRTAPAGPDADFRARCADRLPELRPVAQSAPDRGHDPRPCR